MLLMIVRFASLIRHEFLFNFGWNNLQTVLNNKNHRTCFIIDDFPTSWDIQVSLSFNASWLPLAVLRLICLSLATFWIVSSSFNRLVNLLSFKQLLAVECLGFLAITTITTAETETQTYTAYKACYFPEVMYLCLYTYIIYVYTVVHTSTPRYSIYGIFIQHL